MDMKIVDENGVLVNKHSDGGDHYGWENPLAFVPREGELLTHKRFSREGTGEEKTYRVIRVVYHTEEDYNHSYKGWVEIRVSEVTGA
jgi:hypothetical protein